MQETLAEFLNFSRPLTTLSLVDVGLREAVNEVVRLHAGLASEKRVTFETRGMQPLVVRADPRKVQQMLVNLVQNAIDAVGAGQTVEIEALARGNVAHLSVLDRGPGVSPERLGFILEPGVTTKAKGSGLGLTIVRALAEQHGGRLVLANRDGGGFVATIELPGARVQREAPALAHAVA